MLCIGAKCTVPTRIRTPKRHTRNNEPRRSGVAGRRLADYVRRIRRDAASPSRLMPTSANDAGSGTLVSGRTSESL